MLAAIEDGVAVVRLTATAVSKVVGWSGAIALIKEHENMCHLAVKYVCARETKAREGWVGQGRAGPGKAWCCRRNRTLAAVQNVMKK